eukprot:TRINITY_DN7171_c0_g1_i1.p1 TRINITY_DN7171_c0_g1~~TRINITY_DN7171_c0_g1_i1.p1  ORF type:complete len:700 (-),score=127.13 TRINITY_DN7171_c0_g1_i1:487-2586(-)
MDGSGHSDVVPSAQALASSERRASSRVRFSAEDSVSEVDDEISQGDDEGGRRVGGDRSRCSVMTTHTVDTQIDDTLLESESKSDDDEEIRHARVVEEEYGRKLESMARLVSSDTDACNKSSFIDSSPDFVVTDEQLPMLHRHLQLAFRSHYHELFIGLVVAADFMAICRDTDVRAAGQADAFAGLVMQCCFALYVVDLLIGVFLEGLIILRESVRMLDLVVICVSIFELCLEFSQNVSGSTSSSMVKTIQICRLLRLLRVIKLVGGIAELRSLVQMIASCAKIMFWSFFMSLIIMTIWAVLAVELVHPVVQDLSGKGLWADCERCARSFETVMAANLTFFQTIISGDSWGMLAVPLCEADPATAFVLCGVLISLTYGILQLITAVIVESFSDLRRLDVDALAKEMNEKEKKEKAALHRIFRKIDTDLSGLVTFDELSAGAQQVKELQDWLRVMDVDGGDLARLFDILDHGGQGEVALAEFMDALYRMKNAESRTTTKLVKHIVDNLEISVGQLSSKFEDVQKIVEQMTERETSRLRSQKEQDEMLRRMDDAVSKLSDVATQAAIESAAERIQVLAAPSTKRSGKESPDFEVSSTVSSELTAGLDMWLRPSIDHRGSERQEAVLTLEKIVKHGTDDAVSSAVVEPSSLVGKDATEVSMEWGALELINRPTTSDGVSQAQGDSVLAAKPWAEFLESCHGVP